MRRKLYIYQNLLENIGLAGESGIRAETSNIIKKLGRFMILCIRKQNLPVCFMEIFAENSRKYCSE